MEDPDPTTSADLTDNTVHPAEEDRAATWAATMGGHRSAASHPALVRYAHRDSAAHVGPAPMIRREDREEHEATNLAPGATRASGAGIRAQDELPDQWRTCFERDRDRILHGPAFRRLAGKTQVFVFPEDHQRTRMTHALEVAQVAVAISRAVGLNVALTEAIALGHDCGHGPGGHARRTPSPRTSTEGTTTPSGGPTSSWNRSTCAWRRSTASATIRGHAPRPPRPRARSCRWADRIAYVCHDFEDAVHVGITTPELLPALVRDRCGVRRSHQLGAFLQGVVDAVQQTAAVGMTDPMAEALAEFRRFNYEHIYMRPASIQQSSSVVRVLRALVEHYADRPNSLPQQHPVGVEPGSEQALRRAVTYVGGMTDRYAFAQARARLGWRTQDLPIGIV